MITGILEIAVSVHDSPSIFPSLQLSLDGYLVFASPKKQLNLYILPNTIQIWEHFMCASCSL